MTDRYLSWLAFLALVVLGACGCASYQTPGGPAPLIELAEEDIAEILATEPACSFPARIAVGRIQESRYSAYGTRTHGTGVYQVVTTREIETPESVARLSALPRVAAVAPLSSLLLEGMELDTVKDLRRGAAKLHADLLLLYTLETAFWREDHALAPLSHFTLGIIPSGVHEVRSTASAVLLDVRTGYVYGVAESTASKETLASWLWSGKGVETRRREAESRAFTALVGEVETLWDGVLTAHAPPTEIRTATAEAGAEGDGSPTP